MSKSVLTCQQLPILLDLLHARTTRNWRNIQDLAASENFTYKKLNHFRKTRFLRFRLLGKI